MAKDIRRDVWPARCRTARDPTVEPQRGIRERTRGDPIAKAGRKAPEPGGSQPQSELERVQRLERPLVPQPLDEPKTDLVSRTGRDRCRRLGFDRSCHDDRPLGGRRHWSSTGGRRLRCRVVAYTPIGGRSSFSVHRFAVGNPRSVPRRAPWTTMALDEYSWPSSAPASSTRPSPTNRRILVLLTTKSLYLTGSIFSALNP